MTDKIKTTARQREVLEYMYVYGTAHPYSMPHGRGGGAFNRMIDDMKDRGLLDFDKDSVPRWQVTAKGLAAFGAPADVLAARAKYEVARAAASRRSQAAFEARVAKRVEKRKVSIIAKVREEFGFQGLSGDDDRLWELIQRIVEIEASA